MIVITSLRDYLQYTSTLCSCDVEDFMQDFTPTEKMAIEKARVKEAAGGRKVWYPLTQALLARMVYSVCNYDLLFESILALTTIMTFLSRYFSYFRQTIRRLWRKRRGKFRVGYQKKSKGISSC